VRRRLFIPGPTEVRAEILQALATPQIGHRTPEFRELYGRVTGKLRAVLGTSGRVFLFASSSTGLWEAAVRNLVRERVLFCVQGAFSERWHEVGRRNGKAVGRLDVEWGRAVRAEDVDRELSAGRYDAVAVVHNETSTGVINRLDEIAAAVRAHDDVVLLVEAVSSFAGTPVPVDAWGIDFCLTGTQKALALPAGLAIAAVSARARFALFAEPGRESPTLTCVSNDRGVAVPALIEALGREGVRIANGYGRLKDRTFRIGHMGDVETWALRGVLSAIDRILGTPSA